jgi:hypothetical protein
VFYDLRTDKAYAQLPVHSGRFEWILDKAGGWSGTIPLMDRRVRAQDWRTATMASKTYIGMERNRQVIFGGILWDTNFTDQHDELAVQGEDIWSYFHHRALHREYTSTQWEQLDLINNLVATCQRDTIQPAMVVGGDIGVYLSAYTATGQLRDRTYKATEGH